MLYMLGMLEQLLANELYPLLDLDFGNLFLYLLVLLSYLCHFVLCWLSFRNILNLPLELLDEVYVL